jgi:serine/threonine-protein kinase
MSVSAGTRLGPYDIRALLGAGAMGEVYRATDTRLKRQVAIKVLPQAVATDPDRLVRFQREAEMLASLNHPHIAVIYGLEEADGNKALVMELVEGPTLADRLAQGALPLDEALGIAGQIAEALEAAHERGIIHRDLKPANIKVREDGAVKVLDFGLAKLTDAGGGLRGVDAQVSQLPTVIADTVSHVGAIVGTAAYMSPEQARGREVDKRTDVWAFGAVLFEMLSGSRAFRGEDGTETMAAVMKSEPNWNALPADLPAHVVTLIKGCLRKDRTARIGDMAVARFLLAQSPAMAASTQPRTAVQWNIVVPVVVAALLVGTLVGALVGWYLPRQRGTAARVTQLQMGVAPAEQLVGSGITVRPARTAMALSPDGRSIVFAGARSGASQLYARPLDRAEAIGVSGTEGATGPFFSPDGQWIGFWVGGTIKKVPSGGGTPAVVGDVPARAGSAASWGDDDHIYFENSSAGISKISAAGGMPAVVTRGSADAFKGERHRLPHVLPGGDALVYTTMGPDDWEATTIVVHPLDGGERRTLVQGGADARYVTSGHLVYLKTGTLMAVPFDLDSLETDGAPVALVDGVMQSINQPVYEDETGAGQFAVSSSGSLVYALGGLTPMRDTTLAWVDRKGVAKPLSAIPPGPFISLRLSPDGRRVAVAVRRGPRNRLSDLWVYDVDRGAPTRLTLDGGNFPVWAPDGRRLVYALGNLFTVNADGSSNPAPLTQPEDAQYPSSWARATNTLTFLQYFPSGNKGIWTLAMDGSSNVKPSQFLESRFELWHPELSPDGKLMAYVSTESGTPEVYVQPFPGPGEKTRISTAFGFDPLWTADGRELIFRAFTAEGKQLFMSVPIRSISPFQFDAPRLLFEAKTNEYDSTAPERGWDISPDGQRFLLAKPVTVADPPVTTLQVVLDWVEELRRRVPRP